MVSTRWISCVLIRAATCLSAASCLAQGGGWMSRPDLLDADASVFDLIVYDGELIAAGDFQQIGGVEAGGLAAFDGQGWRPLDDPLRLTSGQGQFVEAWAEVMTVFEGDLIIGGRFNRVGERAVPFMARWNGESLEPLGPGTNGRVASLAVYDSHLILGGFFTEAGLLPTERVARFRSGYAAMDQGFAAGVTALFNLRGELWAGGLFSNSGIRAAPHVARWRDGAWVGAGFGFQTNDGDSPAVFEFASIDGELIALGHFQSSGANRTNGMARWDGSNWVAYRGGLGGNGGIYWATEMVQYLGESYVAGRFASAGGHLANNIARHDGERWWPMGHGVNDEVKALAVFRGELYVGGAFSRAGNLPAQRLAVWKSTNITPPAREELALELFPNPVRGQATIRIRLPEPASVEFRLSDLRGRLLRHWRVEVTSTSAEIPLAGPVTPVANGRYLLSMRVGDSERSRAFVFQR